MSVIDLATKKSEAVQVQCDELVEELERLIVKAKAGEIISIYGITGTPDGGYFKVFSAHGSETLYWMLGALERFKFESLMTQKEMQDDA